MQPNTWAYNKVVSALRYVVVLHPIQGTFKLCKNSSSQSVCLKDNHHPRISWSPHVHRFLKPKTRKPNMVHRQKSLLTSFNRSHLDQMDSVKSVADKETPRRLTWWCRDSFLMTGNYAILFILRVRISETATWFCWKSWLWNLVKRCKP